MAGQDFARVEAQVLQPEDVRPMGQMKVMMLIMVSLVLLAVSFAGGFMMGREQGAQEVNNQDEARLFEQLKKQKEELSALRELAAAKKVETVSTTQVGELTFYNELPNQSVQPAPLDGGVVKVVKPTLKQVLEQELQPSPKNQEKQKKVTGNQQYQLQIASFQNKKEAKSFVLKMKGKGMAASIQKVDLDALGVWYRVYAGVFSSREEALQGRVRFKENLNISSIVVKLE